MPNKKPVGTVPPATGDNHPAKRNGAPANPRQSSSALKSAGVGVPAGEHPAAVVAADSSFPVVGIGASAGGLEPLQQLFTAMPPDCNLAYVVIMHLHPDGPPFLAEMLRRYTTMEVVTAEEGMPLQPNRVHLIPAGRELTVAAGRLRLKEPSGEHHPINRFFSSLAAEVAESAIAVILSGSGIDGTEGVMQVREAGGIVIVQEPSSATSPGMPRSAIASGAADLILAPDDMPAKIAEIARGSCTLPPRACQTATLDEEMRTIFAIVKAKTGHDYSSYKANTVMRRIERRMTVNEVGGLGKYIALLQENPQEAHALSQDILIGVTSFFRDPDAFATLQGEIIPRLFSNHGPDDPVRIWHACCATGEEVYSMAILVQEYLNKMRHGAKVQFFATDIDEAAIARARTGLYADDIEVDVGEERLKTFFTKVNGRWQVAKQLREMIVFAHHSLVKDPPFSRLDLLVCRNFLIYLNPDMQKRLFELFHQVLKPGGILFLGGAETVGRNSELFTPIDKKWKIFERLEGERRIAPLFPFTTPVRMPAGTGRPPRPAGAEEPSPGAAVEKLLMDRYSPPCVVVNEKYEVVHVSTRADRFLELPVGEPTRDILKMAKVDLRPALRAAIFKAFAEQKQMAFRGLKIETEGPTATINLLVEPVTTSSSAEKLAMVIFEPAPSSAPYPAPADIDETLAGDEASKMMLIRHLEEQLRITHEQLRATTDQLESSHEGLMSANEELMSINEEFQSANEELQSTNEELETSKEELHALNEELVTVNAELQGKVEELNHVNNDMENLLTSSEIATLFLDRQMVIKRFTPAMAAIFNLIQADTGRPFRHLAGTIDLSGLPGDVQNVLEKLSPIEREVTTVEDDRCFLMRVLPYREATGKINGIVVTLIDITERKRVEGQTIHLASFPQLNPNPVLEVDSSGSLTFFNPATQKVLESLGMQGADAALFLPNDLDCILESWDRKNATTLFREIFIKERVFGETIFLTPQFNAARFYAFDITERKRADEALRESEKRYHSLFENMMAGFAYCKMLYDNQGAPVDFVYLDVNDAFGRLTGLQNVMGKKVTEVIPGIRESSQDLFDIYGRVALTGLPETFEIEFKPLSAWFAISVYSVEKEHFVAIFDDITERKRVHETLAENEERVRRKLESIISPRGDIGNLDLADIIDARSLQSLVNDFYELTGMPMGLIDLKGKVLVGVGWQDLCTKFHRINPETCRNCVESDLQLSAGVPHGEYKIYKCKNNMWDVATPIMVGDRHLGNLFIGQFFFEAEPLDYELFRSQARQFGFDEQEYIAALEAVPRLSRETLDTCMAFFMKLADNLSQLGYSNLKLARSLAERDFLLDSLRESEERFRTIVEGVRDYAMFSLDPEGRILDWNAGAERMKGYLPEEILGKHFSCFYPPEVAASGLPEQVLRIAERDGRYEGEGWRLRKDGSQFWANFIITAKRDESGRIAGFLKVTRDITERKQAEVDLRTVHDELEKRVAERTDELATTINTLQEEIVEREVAEQKIIRLNQLYTVLSETDQAIVRASDPDSLFRDFCRIAVEDGGFLLSWVGLVDEESGQVRIVAASGATGYLDDIRITKNEEPTGLGPTGISIREGTYYICNDFLNDPITRPWQEMGRAHGIKASASVALKEEDRVIGALTLYAGEKGIFDRQHEELLQQMGADISFALDNLKREASRREAERALQTVTAERLRAVEDLREKERLLIQQSRQAAMGEMIGNIAHQWRQPLNTLGLMVQELSLSHELGEFSKEHLDASVRKIMQIVFHMSQTIDDFRNFFKPDKEQVQFRVTEVVAKTVSLIEGSFINQRISIEVDAEGDPLIDGYPNEYSQVLLNILLNARDALLEKQVAMPQVNVRLFIENGKAVVTVTDNAGGIPEAIMDKIFDPYFTTKAPDKGTGIGLFMSKNIIEKNMRGTLSARNTGAGAEFRIEV